MNYSEQQQFFKRSRMWAAGFSVLLIAVAGLCMAAAPTPSRSSAIAFVLAVLATCISMSYTPNYLQLTVNPQKRRRWQIKIRWRVAGFVLVIGLILVPRDFVVIILAVACLIAVNLWAKRVAHAHSFLAYFWAADWLLLSSLLVSKQLDLVAGAAFFAASAHLVVVSCEKNPFGWAGTVFATAAVIMLEAGEKQRLNFKVSLAAAALVFVIAMGTAWLVRRAQEHHEMNAERAMRELADFTGYPAERIWDLWSTSNQQLAKNWEMAAPGEDDRERLAQWYRENSELYMFAISGYNLEYKRIVSNLRMMRFGHGRCLDYGAGNGELILELARRGHPATYYDVEGETLRFARQRAAQRGLSVEFLHTKDDLAQAAQRHGHGFDTIFSFDVLEHLPDLPGELRFLASLLNPSGLLVFDVPAGATKSHPMHLNHNLDVLVHMRTQGFTEEPQSWLPKLPFSKQEKYLFRAPASYRQSANSKKEPKCSGL